MNPDFVHELVELFDDAGLELVSFVVEDDGSVYVEAQPAVCDCGCEDEEDWDEDLEEEEDEEDVIILFEIEPA